MKRKFTNLLSITLVSFSLALILASCGKNNGVTPITPLLRGEMQATISGFGTFYTKNSQVTDDGSKYTIIASVPTADGSKDSVSITLVAVKQGITPYTINNFSSDQTSEMDYCFLQPTGICNNYRVDQTNGSGALKITSVASGDNVQGTFSGAFQNLAGSGSVTISDGEFYAPF